jgi:hypothetical protein
MNKRRNFVIETLLSHVGMSKVSRGGIENYDLVLNSEISGVPGRDKPRPRKMKN